MGSANGLCEAMKIDEVEERLKLKKISRDPKDHNAVRIIYSVSPSCATTGAGLLEGLVSTDLLVGKWHSSNEGLGLAINEHQDKPATTGQIGVSVPSVTNHTPFDELPTCTTPFSPGYPGFCFSCSRLVFFGLSAGEISNFNIIGLLAYSRHLFCSITPEDGLLKRTLELT